MSTPSFFKINQVYARPPSDYTDAEMAGVIRTVCSYAHDLSDALLLLQALGLTEEVDRCGSGR